MNIFWLSLCLVESARMLCDQHVTKMCTEAAQLAYTALRLRYEEKIQAGECSQVHAEAFFSKAPLVVSKSGESRRGFKSTHAHHPLAVWARQSSANLRTTVEVCDAICDEYSHRFGKVHATKEHARWLLGQVPEIPEGAEMSPPPLCMPEEYQCGDLVTSYRLYYVAEKLKFARYWYRPPPAFVRDHLPRAQMDRAFSDVVRSLKKRKATKPKARKALPASSLSLLPPPILVE